MHLPTIYPSYYLTTRPCVCVRTHIYFGCFVVWARLLRNSRKCESRISAYACQVYTSKSAPFYNRVTEHFHHSYMREETFLSSRQQFWMGLSSTTNVVISQRLWWHWFFIFSMHFCKYIFFTIVQIILNIYLTMCKNKYIRDITN